MEMQEALVRRGVRNRGIESGQQPLKTVKALKGLLISVRSGQAKTLFWIQRLLEVEGDEGTHLNAMLK